MKKFKIYGYNTNVRTLITNSESISSASTYDENLTRKENGRTTLSFKIMQSMLVGGAKNENYFASLIKPFAKLTYEDDIGNLIDLIITDVAYEISKETVIYSVTSEDYASQIFSKIAQGMELECTGTIFEIGLEILNIANKNNGTQLNSWKFNPSWYTNPDAVARDFTSLASSKEASRITLSLTNSNLYNALIELSLLFNATITFDYTNKIIMFKSKTREKFSGYRLSGNINLKTFSVRDTVTNFTTAMNVQGGKDILTGEYISVIPKIPQEVKLFFQECIDNNFYYFGDYYTTNYSSFRDYIIEKFLPTDAINRDEKIIEIEKFLRVCDILPNLSQTFYDIGYFYHHNIITYSKYNRFNQLINNSLRKLNTKILLYSEAYYHYSVSFSTLTSEIKTNINLLVSENIFKTNSKLLSESSITTYDYDKILKEIMLSEDYLAAVFHMYGYTTTANNGFNVLINETNEEISKYSTERSNNLTRLEEIEDLLATAGATDKVILEVEKAGLERRNDYLNRLLGFELVVDNVTNIITGELPTYIEYLTLAKNSVTSYDHLESLYDLLVNIESPINLVVEKRNLMATIYEEYADYIIETSYTNDKELDSYGLLEQSYAVFYGNHPYFDRTTMVKNSDLSFIDNGVAGDYKPGWNNSLHADAITVKDWSTGYLSNIPSPATGYHARFVYGGMDGNNYACMLFQDQNSTYAQTHRLMKIEGNFRLTPAELGLKSGDKLHISWYQKSNTIEKGAKVAISYYSIEESKYKEVFAYVPLKAVDRWEQTFFVTTITDDWDLTKLFKLVVYGNEGAEGLLYVDKIKVHLDPPDEAQYYLNYTGNNTPNRTYDISVIDLSALENYRYMRIEIGDKIEIYEKKLNILQELIRISEIQMPLRNPDNTKLVIDRTNEENILQKILLNL